MFCPQCGTAHTPGGRFCGSCGLLLPFAATSGSTPDAGGRHPGSNGLALSGPAVRHGLAASGPGRRSTVSIPAFTVAVVACVFAFGVVFVAASAALRGLGGESIDDRGSVQARAPSAPQGAMGALLSTRRTQSSDAGKLK